VLKFMATISCRETALMNPAHEMAAETKTETPGAVPGFDHELDEHPALEDFQRLLAIDSQAERAPESQAKRRVSLDRYLVAICIGVAGTLAWQSYGEATKQTAATTAPELGWSPEGKLASWVQQIGWTKPPAGLENAAFWRSASETPQPAPVAQLVREIIASKTAVLDEAAQRQQIALSLAALRQTVEQIAAGQDKMAREINQLAADVEMLSKIPARPPQPPVAPARKPMPTPLPPSSRAPPH
jgi:hypothetical protein